MIPPFFFLTFHSLLRGSFSGEHLILRQWHTHTLLLRLPLSTVFTDSSKRPESIAKLLIRLLVWLLALLVCFVCFFVWLFILSFCAIFLFVWFCLCACFAGDRSSEPSRIGPHVHLGATPGAPRRPGRKNADGRFLGVRGERYFFFSIAPPPCQSTRPPAIVFLSIDISY